MQVASITRQSTYDPTAEFIRQDNAGSDLRLIAQQKGIPLDWVNGFIYDDSAGEGITVYVVDSGLEKDHEEFTLGTNVASRTRYIHVHSDYDGSKPEDDSFVTPDRLKGIAHGTCMVSRVAGHLHGVAKKADPVIVRVPRRLEGSTRTATAEDYLEAVALALDDVIFTKKTKAVLNMSWIYYRFVKNRPLFPAPDDDKADASDGFRIRLRMILRSLIENNVVLVTASGNDALVKLLIFFVFAPN